MDAIVGTVSKGAMTAVNVVVSLVKNGEWGALLAVVASVYMGLFMAARMARTALWTAKWSAIVLAVLTAVGYADSGWKGQPPAGMRGVDWWSQQGARAVPGGGTGVPIVDNVLHAFGGQSAQASRGRRPSQDDSPWQWASMAKTFGQAYAQHGFQTIYNVANDGMAKLAEAAKEPSPTKRQTKGRTRRT